MSRTALLGTNAAAGTVITGAAVLPRTGAAVLLLAVVGVALLVTGLLLVRSGRIAAED